MTYLNRFVPKVRSFDVEDEGETQTFFIRKPRAIEMIKRGDEVKGKDISNEKTNRELIGKYVVNEDGSAIAAEDVEAILAMESTAFTKFSEKLFELISGKKAGEKNA